MTSCSTIFVGDGGWKNQAGRDFPARGRSRRVKIFVTGTGYFPPLLLAIMVMNNRKAGTPDDAG
jgi:hypothetical protein